MKRQELKRDVTVQQWLVVTRAIKEAFPRNWREYIRNLRWHNLMVCYSFTTNGMFVGVELDGYIHT